MVEIRETGVGFGAATLAGTWAGSSQRSWWIRFGGLSIVAPLSGGRWWGATLGVGFLVAAWICLARRAGLLPVLCSKACPTAIAASKWQSLKLHPPVARVAIGVLSVAMLLLPITAYYDMLQAVPIPIEPPPEPNGYEEVIRIAKILSRGTSSGSTGTSAGEPETSPNQRRSMLLDELHAALRRPSVVPIQYRFGYTNLDAIQLLRQLARDLDAEGRQQRLAKQAGDAQQAYLELLQLGLVAGRGGFIVDRLVGTAIADIGIEGLRQLRDELSFDERRALIVALQENETAWEPLAKVHARDCAAVDKSLGWLSRITFAFPSDFRPGTQATEQAEHRRSAKIRLLVCHLAIDQYIADHGYPPRELTDLMPGYLDRVLEDPFSNQPLVYKAAPPEYLLYSVNQDGRDDGGRHSPLPFDGDLFIDPVEVKVW